MTWHDAFAFLEQVWHSRLGVIMFLCIKSKLLKAKGKECILDAFAKSGAALAVGREGSSVKTSREAADRMRDQCRNTLQLCCAIMADTSHLQVGRMLLACSSGIREWFGKSSSRLRSPAECVLWYAELALGAALMRVLHSVSAPAHDLTALARIGFVTDLVGSNHVGVQLDSPFVWAQNDLAKKLWELIHAVITERINGVVEKAFA